MLKFTYEMELPLSQVVDNEIPSLITSKDMAYISRLCAVVHVTNHLLSSLIPYQWLIQNAFLIMMSTAQIGGK